MAKDYVADNAGTGFASFDDDGPNDLESLLATAALGEEEDDQDTSSYFSDDSETVYTSQSEKFEKTAPIAKSAPILEEVKESYVEEAVPADTREEQIQEEEEEVVVEPQVAYTAPAVYTEPVSRPAPSPFTEPAPKSDHSHSSSSSRKINIPSEADEIATAGKVIRIVDAYRKLNSEVRAVASQFITSGSEIVSDEATLVVKVLNVDPMLSISMKSLQESKSLDPVDRAFYVIGLDEDVLYSLGDLVAVFGDPIDKNQTRINYARSLVREIEGLDNRAVNYVESTQSILSAAEGESN